MSSSYQTQNEFPVNCVIYIVIGSKPDHLSDETYAVLVALTAIHTMTCHFSILLNLLVIIALKTKANLQNISNMTLACLDLADVMVGLVVQPLFIAPMLNLVQGETTASSCLLQVTTIFFFNFFCFSSFVSPVPRNCGSVNRHQTSLYLHSNRYQNPCTDYHYFCMGIDYNFKTSCRSLTRNC